MAEPVPDPAAADTMLVVDDVHRSFGVGAGEIHAVRGASFHVRRGELAVLWGKAGSGKTTLLNLIGGLDRPDAGRVVIDGHEVTRLRESELVRLRRETIGFVFQSFGLVPILSAAENVGLPLRLGRTPPAERDERVRLLLALVDLDGHADQRPYELSGGQQQRVAIARALAARPKALVADEPTGQLDSQTGNAVMRLLRTLVRSEGLTALIATHDPQLLDFADRVLRIQDGEILPHDEATIEPSSE